MVSSLNVLVQTSLELINWLNLTTLMESYQKTYMKVSLIPTSD